MKLHHHQIAEVDVYTLQPAEGHTFHTEDLERWEAVDVTTGNIVARHTVDLSYGIVQDWVIGKTPDEPHQVY